MLLTQKHQVETMRRHPSARGQESKAKPRRQNRTGRRAAAVLITAGATKLLLPGGVEAMDNLIFGESPAAEANEVYDRFTEGTARPISLAVDARDYDPETPGSISEAVSEAHELHEKGELADPADGTIHVFNTQVANALFRRINSGSTGPVQGQNVIVGYQDIKTQPE